MGDHARQRKAKTKILKSIRKGKHNAIVSEERRDDVQSSVLLIYTFTSRSVQVI